MTSQSTKERLDILLLNLGLVSTRSQAQALIMAGDVLVDGKVVTKSGTLVKRDAEVEIKRPPEYVSRGGFKLEKAIREFSVDVKDKICVDIGASTGGFTHCLLKFGAKLVYAIDVGKGLLHPILANDPKVKVIEGYNARYLEPSLFPIKPVLATIDVSFISVRKILPALVNCLEGEKEIIILVKPQFEADYKRVSRGGVVVKPEFHVEVIKKVIESSERLYLYPCNLTFSPIKGRAGNIEYLLYLSSKISRGEIDIDKIVEEAFRYFEDDSITTSA
ncbi:MAG: TlyA family RNA methyltransferase [bacterium]|nr:TlyA family RNA methyltransferase [bacterium]